MKRLFSLILVGMLAVSGLSAKVKLSVLYVGGTANMVPIDFMRDHVISCRTG